MSEWWTYSPANFLMFTARTYWRLLERHNTALWPLHVVMVLGAVAALAWNWRRPGDRAMRLTTAWFAVAWILVAGGYFGLRYATIHTAGPWFAVAFALQAGLMLWFGVAPSKPLPADATAWSWQAGLAISAAVILLYPLLPLASDRPWQQTEVFGLAPDPTVLASLGLLLARRAPWWWWLVPVAWCLFSGMTLWSMQASEAWTLLAGAMLTLGIRSFARRSDRGNVGDR